jgi:epoxyqueuosine reductase
MKSLLLHVCCAPCSTEVLERLKEYSVTVFFLNPNIHPEQEYERRLAEVQRFCRRKGIPCEEGRYNPEEWSLLMRGLEDEPEGGLRCERCYRMRLHATAHHAKGSYDLISTTLTISPHKKAVVVNRIGQEIEEVTGVPFLEADWKKQAGFEKSLAHSRVHGLYRQDYCGCSFSRKRIIESPKE